MPFYLSIVFCNYFRFRLCTSSSTKLNAYRRRIFPTYWMSLSGRSYPALYRRDFSHVSTMHPPCSQIEVYGPGFYLNIAYARETLTSGISSRDNALSLTASSLLPIFLNMIEHVPPDRISASKRH